MTKNNFLKFNKKHSSTKKGLKNSPIEPLATDTVGTPTFQGTKQSAQNWPVAQGAPKGGNTRSVIAGSPRGKDGRTSSVPNTPLGVNMDRTPSSEQADNSNMVVVDTSRFRSVLMLLEDSELELQVERAAQATASQTRKVTRAFDPIVFPAFLAVVDPVLLTEEEWETICDGLGDRGPESIKILLTRPCPYAATLPSYLATPTPEKLDGGFLEQLMRDLRTPPPSIARLAPFYPALIAQMPRKFEGFTFLKVLVDRQPQLFYAALETELEARCPHITLDNMPRDMDSPNGALAERCVRTVSSLLCRQLHEFPHLVESLGQELGPELWPDEERQRVWTKLSR